MPYLIRDEAHPIGGATIELYALINGLVINGHKVGVLTWKGAKKYIQKSVAFDIVETYDLNEGIPKLRWIYSRYPTLFKAVKSYNPDFLFQASAAFETGVMAYIGKKLNIKFIYKAANNIDADYGYKKRLNLREQLFYRYGLNNAAAIICQNSYQKNNFSSHYIYKKIFILHFPYLFRAYFPERREFSERKYIAWVGNFHYQKNLPALLRTVKKLPKLPFKIVGGKSKKLDIRTENAIEELKKCKNVEFLGYLRRAELSNFLSRAFALLSTSHYEGYPYIFLDSFAVGTPVVTITKIDPDNIITTNNLGIIKKDYSDLPYALISIINDKNYNIISKRCKEYLIKNHDPKTLAEKFIENLQTS